MKHGDLSNGYAFKTVIMFDGFLGRIPSGAAVLDASQLAAEGRWNECLDCYVPNDHVIDVLWNTIRRHDIRFDVATLHNFKPFVEALKEWIVMNNVPAGNVLAYNDLQDMERGLSRMPDVNRVVHSLAASSMAFGARGRFVGNPSTWRFF